MRAIRAGMPVPGSVYFLAVLINNAYMSFISENPVLSMNTDPGRKDL
jgi:hypothetical protein